MLDKDLDLIWKLTEIEIEGLNSLIRLRQQRVDKDEIRKDPELMRLRARCVELHAARIRVNVRRVALERAARKRG